MASHKLTSTQQALVESNHRLIYKVISVLHLNADEYYDVAAIALCKAATTYDPKQSKFDTFAYWVMYNALINAIRQQNTAKSSAGVVASLDYYRDNGKELPVFSHVDVEKECCNRDLVKWLFKTARDKGQERDVQMIIDAFFNQMSYAEIGKKYGITRQRVKQVLQRSLRKMQTMVHNNGNSVP